MCELVVRDLYILRLLSSRRSIYGGKERVLEGDIPMSNQQQNGSFLWVVLVILAVIVLTPLLMMMFAMPMTGMMGWWGGGAAGTGFSPLWSIAMMLLALIAVVAIGYILYRGLIGDQDFHRDPALEELRAAYARGELSDEEFERRRQRLQQDRE